MKQFQFDFFTLIIDTLKLKPGCHLLLFNTFDDASDVSDVLTFESKDEFDLYFDTKPHPYYPSNVYIPKNIVKEYGDRMYDCIVDGMTVYVNMRKAYFIMDGKLIY